MNAKKEFDVERMMAEIISRYPSKFDNKNTQGVWLADYKRVLGKASPGDIEQAYHKTIGSQKYPAPPLPSEIAANLINRHGEKGIGFHKKMQAFVDDNYTAILDEINLICHEEISRARNNGWNDINYYLKITAENQAATEFLFSAGRVHRMVNMTETEERAKLHKICKYTKIGYNEFSGREYDWLNRRAESSPVKYERQKGT